MNVQAFASGVIIGLLVVAMLCARRSSACAPGAGRINPFKRGQ